MKKIIKLMFIGLILSVFFMAGCSKDASAKLPDSIGKLKYENIKAAKIEPERTGENPIKDYRFDLNNPEQIKILKDIVKQLNSAKVQGNADEKVINKGSTPTFLIIELKDGSVIQIKSAIGGKAAKLSDGSTEISQYNIPNQITIIINSNTKPFRVLSPEIKELIDGGYKNIFKI